MPLTIGRSQVVCKKKRSSKRARDRLLLENFGHKLYCARKKKNFGAYKRASDEQKKHCAAHRGERKTIRRHQQTAATAAVDACVFSDKRPLAPPTSSSSSRRRRRRDRASATLVAAGGSRAALIANAQRAPSAIKKNTFTRLEELPT